MEEYSNKIHKMKELRDTGVGAYNYKETKAISTAVIAPICTKGHRLISIKKVVIIVPQVDRQY